MPSSRKPFVRPAVAGLGLVGILMATSGTASALPAGSYRQSCQNVSQVGDVLRASCRTKAGALRATTYQVSRCQKEGDNLSNIDGYLRCAEKLPQGSYLQTCATATTNLGHGLGVVFDGILYTTCKTIDGRIRQTSIRVSSCAGQVIANINGKLTCSRR